MIGVWSLAGALGLAGLGLRAAAAGGGGLAQHGGDGSPGELIARGLGGLARAGRCAGPGR